MFRNLEIISIEEKENNAHEEIKEIFQKFIEINNITYLQNISIIMFDIDETLFQQNDKYIKIPKLEKLSQIGKIQKILIQACDESNQTVYFIGNTTRAITDNDLQNILNNNIQLDLIISRDQNNKNSKQKLHEDQIQIIKTLKNTYGINLAIAFTTNNYLINTCLKHFILVPNLKLYEQEIEVLIPLAIIFLQSIIAPYKHLD